MKLEIVGKWAFLIGLIIAVLMGFISSYASTLMVILFILGLLVGFLNISTKDSIRFLVAIIALLVGGLASLSAISVLGVVSTYVIAIVGNFIAFVSAAALVVAIKSVLETSKK